MPVPEIRFEAAVNYDDSLWRAAAESAVDSGYWDIFGHQHHVSREALQSILQSLGWDTSSFEAIEAKRRNRFIEAAQAGVTKTSVVSENDKWMALSVAGREDSSIGYEIRLEDGQVLAGTVDVYQLQPINRLICDSQRWSIYRLDLPVELPLGYHELSVTVDGRVAGESYLIVCPDRAYLPPDLAGGGRTAGFNVALYGLRSERNWGCGDFSDLKVLVDWAAKDVGFSFIGLNPLHALHNRTPYNTSPYLPLSMYYKNLIYIDIESIPEFASSVCAQNLLSSARIQNKIRQLRDAEFVEYSEVDRLKRRFLKLLHREFRRAPIPERRRAFASYCHREGELLTRFALYSALDEALHKQNRDLWTWRDWPAHYQDPASPETQSFAREHTRSVEFYQYIQFVIEEQLAEAQQHAKQSGMPIGLYHDLAVATDNFGSDLWAYPERYIADCRVGAPAG